jgi:6-phosphogluconate dehydrogenase
MQVGMIGVGRMGGNMVRRLMRAGHACVVFDVSAEAVAAVVADGAAGAASREAFVQALRPPRTVWLMLPAGLVDSEVQALVPLLAAGDTIVDGGNSHYHDDIRRAGALASGGLHYVDVGTSGGVWGLERGYCLTIGGAAAVVQRLEAVFAALAPGIGAASCTPGRSGAGASATAEQGYLHCGGAGAGHFVKMVHNGIEYGLMAAYAEGLNVLRHANVGTRPRGPDADVTPLSHPEHYQYSFNLPDIAEVWRRGSVVASWLLDLSAAALAADPELARFGGRVGDSGEGRWTIAAALDESVPVPVLSAALYDRFSSRGEGDFAHKVLSALRAQFGGHRERDR